jgi:hypothetical protein
MVKREAMNAVQVVIREATLGADSRMLGAATLARSEDKEYVLGVSTALA